VRFAQIDDVRLKYFFFSMFPTMMWQGWHMFRALKHKKGSDVRLKDYVVLNSLELWSPCLREAFTCADHKSVKIQSSCSVYLRFWDLHT